MTQNLYIHFYKWDLLNHKINISFDVDLMMAHDIILSHHEKRSNVCAGKMIQSRSAEGAEST